MLQLGRFCVPFWVVFQLSAISVTLSCSFSVTSCVGFLFRPGPCHHCWYSVFFYLRYNTCFLPALPPSAAFGPQELLIFENMSRGSRAQPALEDSCCHRRGGLQPGTPLAAFAGMTWINHTLDQPSQLMWAKVAADPSVTL